MYALLLSRCARWCCGSLLMFLASVGTVACTEQAEDLVGTAHGTEVSAKAQAYAKGFSPPGATQASTYNLTLAWTPTLNAQGTGSIVFDPVFAKEGMPTSVSYTTNTLTYTLNGLSETYTLSATQQKMLGDLLDAYTSTTQLTPHPQVNRAALSRPELVVHFQEQGYDVTVLDADRYRLKKQMRTFTFEKQAPVIEIIYNAHTHQIEHSTTFRDGVARAHHSVTQQLNGSAQISGTYVLDERNETLTATRTITTY